MKRFAAAVLALVMIGSVCGALAEKGFTVQNVYYDTAILAKAAVVDRYELYTGVNCSDYNTCVGYPLRVQVLEADPETDAFMIYYCGENFIQRNSHSLYRHQEGTLDPEFGIFMKEYTPAYNYCSERANQILSTMGIDARLSGTRLDDMTSFGQLIKSREDYLSREIFPFMPAAGMNLQWSEVTAAERVFSFMFGGKKYYIAVMAEVYGYQYTINAYNTRTTLWEVPFYYALICPESIYQEVHDTDFRIFRENTGINDEFIALNERLSQKIAQTQNQIWNMQAAASMAYMETMTALTFSVVDSTLGGHYSTTDSFSDYIFDQNDYTTLDGDHVKVSTSYDYVYQSGSSVYYTNDALSIPADAVMLTPNR